MTRITGPNLPQDVPELAPALERMARGVRRRLVVSLTVVCPGCSRTLLEAIPADGSHVLLSPVWLAPIYGDPYRHDREGSRIVIEGTHMLGTETIEAAATLTDAPVCWWVRCCSVHGIETAWVTEQLAAGKRRAVVVSGG